VLCGGRGEAPGFAERALLLLPFRLRLAENLLDLMGAGGSVVPGRYSVDEAESYCRQNEMEPNSLSLFLSTDGKIEIPEDWMTKLPVTTDAPPTNVEEDGDGEEDESVASLRTTTGSHIMILYCTPSDDDVSRELVTELRRNLCERGCDVWLDIHGSKRLPHDESTDWQAKARIAVDFTSHVIVCHRRQEVYYQARVQSPARVHKIAALK